MTTRRQSPVQFEVEVLASTERNDWPVVLEYRDEGPGPWLVDLSHRGRWDYQHTVMDSQAPFGLRIPAKPGQVSVQHDMLVSRMNGTQLAIWNLGRDEPEAVPGDQARTDMTDTHCLLAVIGTDAQSVMEHLSNLDLFNPNREMPFLTQGPVMHIPCQVVTLGPDCVLMTFSRGYGQTFADSALHAASGCMLKPGGEKQFDSWRQRQTLRD
ncbi:sarcosine oxidase subunit gamma SoxG [Pseudomonadota bacterium]